MRTEIKLITPQLAKIYLEKNNTNRPIRKKTVAFYADQMLRNLWQVTGQGISFDINNNLIDGQHRLSAIIKSERAQNMLVIYGLDEASFKVYDTGKPRSSSDVLSVAGVSDSTHIAAGIITYNKIKANIYSNNQRELYITNTDVLNLYNSNAEFYREINLIAQRIYSKNRIISRSIIFGIICFLNLEKIYSIKTVTEFFEQVFGISPDTYQSTSQLRDFLIKEAMSYKKISIKHRILFISRTWNKYITGGGRTTFSIDQSKENKIEFI